MWIKICGVTTVDDAIMISGFGVSAIGLNFFSGSPRCVSATAAKSIRDAVCQQLDVVGVFVNSPQDKVAQIADCVELDAVQFHGDETAETIAAFHQARPQVAIIRAFRIGADGITAMADSIDQLLAAGVRPAAVLVDAHVPGEYGGTGAQVASNVLKDCPKQWPRLILAGGLTAGNVGSATEAVRPWGLDTASGVEQAPGVKCSHKVGRFMSALPAGNSQERLPLPAP